MIPLLLSQLLEPLVPDARSQPVPVTEKKEEKFAMVTLSAAVLPLVTSEVPP
jgi:hypothetical protein